jgi:hypothetical protein
MSAEERKVRMVRAGAWATHNMQTTRGLPGALTVVAENLNLGARQTGAKDEGRVVELIADDEGALGKAEK